LATFDFGVFGFGSGPDLLTIFFGLNGNFFAFLSAFFAFLAAFFAFLASFFSALLFFGLDSGLGRFTTGAIGGTGAFSEAIGAFSSDLVAGAFLRTSSSGAPTPTIVGASVFYYTGLKTSSSGAPTPSIVGASVF